jgi:ribosomal protein S7
VQSSKGFTKKNYVLNLLNEILDSFNNNGNSVKKRKEFHLLAYENKSYIRFLRFLKS